MEMACQDSYPLNSAKASPPGTFTVYLSWADMAQPPQTVSHTVATPIVNLLVRFIAAPRELHARVRVMVTSSSGSNQRRAAQSIRRRYRQYLRIDPGEPDTKI